MDHNSIPMNTSETLQNILGSRENFTIFIVNFSLILRAFGDLPSVKGISVHYRGILNVGILFSVIVIKRFS
jgi:hypothetical protein